MVEQEFSKKSTVFPASLILDKTSQNHTLNEWFVNEAISMRRSEELSNSDLLYLLYGHSVLPPDKDVSFLLSNESATEKDKDAYSLLVNESCTGKDNLIQETLPRIVSIQEAIPWECSNQNMFDMKDYFDPMSENIPDSYSEVQSPLSFWGSSHDLETLKMDDIFQVDKDDLVQSPTLAELNAIDESLFDSFDKVEIPLRHKNGKSQSLTPDLNSSGSASKRSSFMETLQIKTIPETSSIGVSLFLQKDTCEKESAPKNQMRSDFNSTEKKKDSLSPKSSEKANVALQVTTKFREKVHSSNESSVKKADVKVVDNASDLPLQIKQESPESEDEKWPIIEMNCGCSSDGDEESEEETEVNLPKYTSANSLLQKKKSRYFWQYNIQSKGPKAPKVKLEEKSTVLDNLSAISDPVFTSRNLIKGIKHAGKARRGDGNDLTPNPQKLYNIGLELEKLDAVIEGLVPANELPLNARMKSRKEKNKLASRACRLKKKAQHEANKLKLFGLRKEQKLLLGVIKQAKKIIKKHVDKLEHGKLQSSSHAKVAALCKKTHCTQVAGCSAEFVNNVLRTINQGDGTGGLDVEVKDE